MSQGATSLKNDLLAEIETEHEQIQARIRENQQLIVQTQLEVERLRERNVAISAQLSRVEANFDTIPRPDIKAAYDNALDAKTRLLSMQGQLDKLKGNQEELQHIEQLLGRLLAMLRGVQPDQLAEGGVAAGADDFFGKQSGLSTKAIISMVEAQEEERQRLARQMHDGPAQSLTNFILQAEICQRLFDRDPARAAEELGNLKTAASETFLKVRDFIFDLRPMMLDDLGLVPTTRRYVEAFQDKTNIEAKLNILGDDHRLPAHIEVMMFRAIQSIMGYARDELDASSMTIVLDVGTTTVKATIEHDGRNFDPDTVFSSASSEDASGLRTLRDRIELVGGSLDVQSAEDELTRYVIMLPATANVEE